MHYCSWALLHALFLYGIFDCHLLCPVREKNVPKIERTVRVASSSSNNSENLYARSREMVCMLLRVTRVRPISFFFFERKQSLHVKSQEVDKEKMPSK